MEDRSDISDVLIKNVAQSLARFNVALKDFDHPVARRTHRWNLTGTAQHRVKAQLITSPEKKALVNWGFDSWQQSESRLSTLPHQFIHGDANRENILVRGDQVIALVDFGDSCHNPTICDLAIGATYLMLDQEDPVETAALVVAAYHQVRPLSRAELATMYSLVCGRLAVSISVATARQTIDPENTNWFGSLESCYVLLEQLKSISSERFFSTLCSAVQM